MQTDVSKAEAPFPVGIHAAAFTGQVDGIALQTADQHSDRDQQQQPIDPCGIPQATVLQLEDAGFLIAEQLLAAEALPVSPDQIQLGIAVADQVPGLGYRDADWPGKNQVGPLAAIAPEVHIPKATAVAARQVPWTSVSPRSRIT